MRIHRISILLAFSCILFSTITFASTTMFINKFNLNTENQLKDNFNPVINDFWEKNARANRFLGVDDKEIYTVSIKNNNQNAIVLSQGRNENALKYKELAFELDQQGYDLYLIDHRGQGFSQRLGGDNYRGHVEHFQDYVDDLDQYVSSLDLPSTYQNSYLLSHSMGGTIAALYLEQFKHPFTAAVFFSPMFSINLGIPEKVAKILTYSSAKVCNWFSNKPCYIFSGHDYRKTPFAENHVTSSRIRFNSSTQTFEDNPQAQLGSPTMHWVSQSITACQQAIENANKINIPILVIQAGADQVVTSKGQKQFITNATFYEDNRLINIPNAQHEILLEQDQYRMPALNSTLEFLTSH